MRCTCAHDASGRGATPFRPQAEDPSTRDFVAEALVTLTLEHLEKYWASDERWKVGIGVFWGVARGGSGAWV